MGKYDLDFHAWTAEQADAVRRRSANEIDWDNVAEELEGLGKQVAWELYNRYRALVMHLLKWRFQPGGRSKSWRNTINAQRADIARLVFKNPSLKSVDEEEFEAAYRAARQEAAGETHIELSAFPKAPPFTSAEARSDTYWPD